MNTTTHPSSVSSTAVPRAEAATLVRTLLRWSWALRFLGGFIGIPASLATAWLLYMCFGPPALPPPTVDVGVLLVLSLGGAMLLGALLSLGGHMVAASAHRLQVTQPQAQ